MLHLFLIMKINTQKKQLITVKQLGDEDIGELENSIIHKRSLGGKVAKETILKQQLKSISPRIICALGTFAAKTLLKTDVPISVLRGRFHSYEGIKLMPTYHPAYLLRNPSAKKPVWEDVQMIMKEVNN